MLAAVSWHVFVLIDEVREVSGTSQKSLLARQLSGFLLPSVDRHNCHNSNIIFALVSVQLAGNLRRRRQYRLASRPRHTTRPSQILYEHSITRSVSSRRCA